MSSQLYEVFRETARRQPQHPAIIGPGSDAMLTYGELNQAVLEMAERLRRAGVQAGDCVGLHFPSGRRYMVMTYALWACGACVVPIATELAPSEKAGILQEIAIDHLVSRRGVATFAEPCARGDELRLTDEAIHRTIASPRSRPNGYDSVDAAFIRFTSGTTGASKGVVLSHRTIRDRIAAANEVLGIGPDDRIVWLLSMAYHFTVSIVSYLTHGATLVLPENNFAEAVVSATRRHGATMIYASPAHWALMAQYPHAAPLETLRLAISTTAALDGGVAEKFHGRYGLPLSQALGIIEVGLPCINLGSAADKSDSVGRVLPAFEIRLDDVGLGDSLRQVFLRGPGMLDAYYSPWQTRDRILADGWFDTGDIGELDADGCLYLRGRRKDVISQMGMKYFPQEVEAVLLAHPAVSAASVFAVPDHHWGEVPHARVVVNYGIERHGLEKNIHRWCTERLAFYKVPELIEIVDSLACTASGKIVRRSIEGAPR